MNAWPTISLMYLVASVHAAEVVQGDNATCTAASTKCPFFYREVAGCHNCARHPSLRLWRASVGTGSKDAALDGVATYEPPTGIRYTKSAPDVVSKKTCTFKRTDMLTNPLCLKRQDPNAESTLVAQSLRAIDGRLTYSAHLRPVPHAYAAGVTREGLGHEYNETRTFLMKKLKKDPKLKPEDVIVDLSHLSSCTSCYNYVRSHHSQHCQLLRNGRDERGLSWNCGRPVTRDFGFRRQLLLDDWAIDTWRNVQRFLNGAQRKVVTKFPPWPRAPYEPNAALPIDEAISRRFGCPCSAVSMPDGSIRLWHATGRPRENQLKKINADEHSIVMSQSAARARVAHACSHARSHAQTTQCERTCR